MSGAARVPDAAGAARPARRPSAGAAALVAACALLAAGSGCASGDAGRRLPPAPAVDAPVVLASSSEDLFVVAAETPDGRELALLVDTGSDTTLLDLARAEALGLAVRPLAGDHTVTGSDGRSARIEHVVALDGLRFAGEASGALTVGGFDAPAVDFSDVGFDIDGLIGWDLLRSLTLVFDPDAHRLHVLAIGAGQDDVVAYLGAGGPWPTEWQRMEMGSGEQPMLEVGPESGPTVDLLLDTGATGTSFPAALLDGLDLEPLGTNTSGTLTGRHVSARYRVGAFELGTWNVACDVTETPRPYGLLGMNVLGEFVFVVEGPGRALWLGRRAE